MWAALPALSKRLNLGAGSEDRDLWRDFFCAGHASLVFRHACKMGLEGIVSKRLGSRYRSGRSPDWLKMKKAEEDWR
jgi:ATP-dependent DNA ligase